MKWNGKCSWWCVCVYIYVCGDIIYNSKVLCRIHFTDRHESFLHIRNSTDCYSKWSHFDSPDLSVCMVKLWVFWCLYSIYVSDNLKNWCMVYEDAVLFLLLMLRMSEFVWNFLGYLKGSLLIKIYVRVQEVESSNLWHRLLHEFIGISARWIHPAPPPHELFHISLWTKVGKMNCESISVADVKYKSNYICRV